MYGEHWLLVAITVSLALVGIVLWGTLVGALLPLILRRLGFDPATSSAPFVATLVDVTGLDYAQAALVLGARREQVSSWVAEGRARLMAS